MTERVLRAAIAALAAVGIGIASYLTYTHLQDVAPICTTGGCEKVQTSSYSEVAGIPVAAFGLVAYVAILASAFSRRDLALAGGAVVAVSGAAYAAYLLYVQLAIIDAVCVWCVASDVTIWLLSILTVWRVYKYGLWTPASSPPSAPSSSGGASPRPRSASD